MRILKLTVAALALSATAATASPLRSLAREMAGAATERIHHKPGHNGGPPWMRGRNDRRADERRVERSGPTRICETQYRRDYDPYYDEYVRRPVQVCRNVY